METNCPGGTQNPPGGKITIFGYTKENWCFSHQVLCVIHQKASTRLEKSIGVHIVDLEFDLDLSGSTNDDHRYSACYEIVRFRMGVYSSCVTDLQNALNDPLLTLYMTLTLE